MSDRVWDLLGRGGLGYAALCLAAGLVALWGLRGAAPGRRPPAETDPGSPSPGRRDRAAIWVVLGLELIAAAAFVAIGVGIPWSVPLFAAGFLVLGGVGRANRSFRHASPSLRRIVRCADSATSACLLLGILVVGNVLAFRYGDRPIDCTDERVFSLESLTVNQLKTLQRPVSFTAFFGQSDRAFKQLERVQQLLELYRAQNPAMVAVDTVALDADPRQTEELIRRFPDVATNPTGGGVAILYGEGASGSTWVVRTSDLFELTRTGDPNRAEVAFRGEDALTSALIRLREGTRSRVGIASGHGEPPVVASGGRASLSRLKNRLEGQGIEVVEVDLSRGGPPEELAALLLIGARAPFTPEEIGRLSAFQDRGGRGVVLLDGRGQTGLEAWLGRCNIEVGPGVIVDPRAPIPATRRSCRFRSARGPPTRWWPRWPTARS